jgi:hypothetical protein
MDFVFQSEKNDRATEQDAVPVIGNVNPTHFAQADLPPQIRRNG